MDQILISVNNTPKGPFRVEKSVAIQSDLDCQTNKIPIINTGKKYVFATLQNTNRMKKHTGFWQQIQK
jgi:hypothetical protein